jgi:hypothetical protein
VSPPPRAVIIDVEKIKKLGANLKIISIGCVRREAHNCGGGTGIHFFENQVVKRTLQRLTGSGNHALAANRVIVSLILSAAGERQLSAVLNFKLLSPLFELPLSSGLCAADSAAPHFAPIIPLLLLAKKNELSVGEPQT